MSNLTYCEKCGNIGSSLFWDIQEKGCFSCHAKDTTKPVPKEYLSVTGNTIEENLKEEFIEKFIKSSPNFDQTSWDKRVGYHETRKRQNEMAKNKIQEQKNAPKCPTCSSTNITRISTTSKIVNVAMFGLLGQKRKHQFKCKNCGYEW